MSKGNNPPNYPPPINPSPHPSSSSTLERDIKILQKEALIEFTSLIKMAKVILLHYYLPKTLIKEPEGDEKL